MAQERQASRKPGADNNARDAQAMVQIPGGTFTMGSDAHYPEESPAHAVTVAPFRMDRHPVTNNAFRRFVDATGYVTSAEKPANASDYPGARAELLIASSIVFSRPSHRAGVCDTFNWWVYMPGADWRHPRGPDSTLQGHWDHPVVHVTFEDAQAYADWIGHALPTEAEWEFAARGGTEGAAYVWGDEYMPGGKCMANTWQGEFPHENTLGDGYEWTSPVGSFPPNGFGLYDMAGNVWEWTTDWYQDHRAAVKGCCAMDNPLGGTREGSIDTHMRAARMPRKVTKGGSYLCAPNYCQRYRPAARMAQDVDTSTGHLGFRCIVRDR